VLMLDEWPVKWVHLLGAVQAPSSWSSWPGTGGTHATGDDGRVSPAESASSVCRFTLNRPPAPGFPASAVGGGIEVRLDSHCEEDRLWLERLRAGCSGGSGASPASHGPWLVSVVGTVNMHPSLHVYATTAKGGSLALVTSSEGTLQSHQVAIERARLLRVQMVSERAERADQAAAAAANGAKAFSRLRVPKRSLTDEERQHERVVKQRRLAVLEGLRSDSSRWIVPRVRAAASAAGVDVDPPVAANRPRSRPTDGLESNRGDGLQPPSSRQGCLSRAYGNGYANGRSVVFGQAAERRDYILAHTGAREPPDHNQRARAPAGRMAFCQQDAALPGNAPTRHRVATVTSTR
jgi:hypothetical protein